MPTGTGRDAGAVRQGAQARPLHGCGAGPDGGTRSGSTSRHRWRRWRDRQARPKGWSGRRRPRRRISPASDELAAGAGDPRPRARPRRVAPRSLPIGPRPGPGSTPTPAASLSSTHRTASAPGGGIGAPGMMRGHAPRDDRAKGGGVHPGRNICTTSSARGGPLSVGGESRYSQSADLSKSGKFAYGVDGILQYSPGCVQADTPNGERARNKERSTGPLRRTGDRASAEYKEAAGAPLRTSPRRSGCEG